MDAFKFSRILVSGLVFCICGILIYIFFSRTSGGQASMQELIDTAKTGMAIGGVASCGVVFGNCDLEIKKEDAICNPQKLIEEVRKGAANPLADQACVDVVEKMRKQCSTGCSLLSESLINVPGEIKVEISYTDPKTNSMQILSPGIKIPEVPCTAIGRRSVNLKADCG